MRRYAMADRNPCNLCHVDVSEEKMKSEQLDEETSRKQERYNMKDNGWLGVG
jgi:hypothetical protein